MPTKIGPTVALILVLQGCPASAGPFSDVPRGHWAFDAIGRVAEAGIMEGDQGRFRGEGPVNRYQVAIVVDRMLRALRAGGGPSPDPAVVGDLERLTSEFSEELELLGTRVETFEAGLQELRTDLDRLKAGSGNKGAPTGLAQAFTGLVSVGLISTDDGPSVAPAPAAAGAPLTRYTATVPDQTFFTIPQASIQLNQKVGDGIGIHVQYDYGTDALNAGGTVGLNAAYVTVDRLFGRVGAKVGGFNGPFISWEATGPHRTFNHAITLSAVNTFLFRGRVVGIELSPMVDVKPTDLRWKLALFTSPDFALPPTAPRVAVGAMNDALFMAPLAASRTFDDTMGWYFDLESAADPARDWGWRVSAFDRGGDVSASPGGAAPSQEVTGYHAGLWWKRDDLKLVFQHLWAENRFADLPAGGTSDIRAWYLMGLYRVDEDDSVTLRYDSWENEIDTAVASGLEGDAITFAWNHKTSATSIVQFEYLAPDEESIAPGGGPDVDDDLIQLRYKVWF